MINDNSLTQEIFDKILKLQSENDYKDIFNDFKRSKESLVKLIKNNKDLSKHSNYVVCLDASWGAGKSSLLNLVKEEVENQNEKHCIKKKFISPKFVWINYDPWNYANETELITDFFTTLDKKFYHIYKQHLSNSLDKYIELISPAMEMRPWLKASHGIFKNILPVKTLCEIKKGIKDKLKNAPEKFVIIFDDVDRLLPEQIPNVIKLIKIFSDFPNLIFILAMDYKNVSECLSQKVFIPEYSNYLQKIINTRIQLKPYTYKELEAILVFWIKEELTKKNAWNQKYKAILEKIFEIYVLGAKAKQVKSFQTNNPIKLENRKKDENEKPIISIYEPEYIFFNPIYTKFYSPKTLLDSYRISSYLFTWIGFLITQFAQNDFGKSTIKEKLSEAIKSTIREIKCIHLIKKIDDQLALGEKEIKNLAEKYLATWGEYIQKKLAPEEKVKYKENRENELYDFKIPFLSPPKKGHDGEINSVRKYLFLDPLDSKDRNKKKLKEEKELKAYLKHFFQDRYKDFPCPTIQNSKNNSNTKTKFIETKIKSLIKIIEDEKLYLNKADKKKEQDHKKIADWLIENLMTPRHVKQLVNEIISENNWQEEILEKENEVKWQEIVDRTIQKQNF